MSDTSSSSSSEKLARGRAAAAPHLELAELHRYTITSEGASLGYFRLVEDPEGAWMQAAEVLSMLRAGASPGPHPQETEEDTKR